MRQQEPRTEGAVVRRGGRPHLGERRLLASRVKPELHAAVRAAAEQRGMSITDFVAATMREAVEHEDQVA